MKEQKLNIQPIKVEKVKYGICEGCDVEGKLEKFYKDYFLCNDCNANYYDSTDDCSLSCCLGNNCDGSC